MTEFPIRLSLTGGRTLLINVNGSIQIINDDGYKETLVTPDFYYLDMATLKQAIAFGERARENFLAELKENQGEVKK